MDVLYDQQLTAVFLLRVVLITGALAAVYLWWRGWKA